MNSGEAGRESPLGGAAPTTLGDDTHTSIRGYVFNCELKTGAMVGGM